MGGSIRFLEAGRSIVAYGIRAHPTDLEYVHCTALFTQVSHYHSRQIRKGSKCICRAQPLMADSLGSLEIFCRNWVLRTFVLPIDGHDPPTTTVVEQLNTVDPAYKRFGIVRAVTRFVGAPDMRYTPKLFGTPRNLFFVKSMPRKIRFHALN